MLESIFFTLAPREGLDNVEGGLFHLMCVCVLLGLFPLCKISQNSIMSCCPVFCSAQQQQDTSKIRDFLYHSNIVLNALNFVNLDSI